jgi:hypothetical protein
VIKSCTESSKERTNGSDECIADKNNIESDCENFQLNNNFPITLNNHNNESAQKMLKKRARVLRSTGLSIEDVAAILNIPQRIILKWCSLQVIII